MNSSVIKDIQAVIEFDSRGEKTIKGILTLDNSVKITATIPNHLSAAKYEAKYIDTLKSQQYINTLIGPKLVGTSPLEHKKIDLWLLKTDSSTDKAVIGANTTLLISKLVYRAAAELSNIPLYKLLNNAYTQSFGRLELNKLPSPIFTMISGGRHGSPLLNFQEFSVIFSTGLTYSTALEKCADLYKELRNVFEYRNIFAGVGNDGAYVPSLSSNTDALEILKEAMLKQGFNIGIDTYFALDIAASSLFKGGRYYLSEEAGNFDTNKLVKFYENLFKQYRYLVLEDPFAEEDIKGWQGIQTALGDKVYVMGDDLISTNKERLEKSLKSNLCSTVDIKLPQRGTVWEIFEFIAGAKKAGMKTVFSQSAVETVDDFIADLAYAIQTDFVKFGPPVRGERVVKHNRLLQIEREAHS
jgi:enolase